MRIGIDLMGGDQPPHILFEALLQLSEELESGDAFVVFATHDFIASVKAHEKIEFVEVGSVIEMSDAPLTALRRKKDSSLVQGVFFLKEKKIDAFVSTGNTGALVAAGRILMPLLPEIEMPALCVHLPKEKGLIAVLDVGANIAFAPHHVVDYAKLGVAYQICAQKIERPKIGLLNIGSEEIKGTKLIKEGFLLLSEFAKAKGMDFVGNVESREVFQGDIDVLVTEGFTGNVFLKTCEGASSFLIDYLKGFAKSAPALIPVLQELHERFNYAKYPGAQLLGIDGLIIKCHGYSNRDALMSGIRGAMKMAKENLIEKMKKQLMA